MRSEKPSWPRILRRHCTEGLDGWTFTKKAMIAARGRERQKRTRNAQCYNFTSQKCNGNGNATLSLSLFLCQCINVVSPTGGSPWGEAQGLDSSHMGLNVTSRGNCYMFHYMNVLSDLSPSRSRTLSLDSSDLLMLTSKTLAPLPTLAGPCCLWLACWRNSRLQTLESQRGIER